jgi:hypothetical protein
MTKQEIAELVFTKDQLRNIDFAIPMEWADKMRDMGVQPFWYVWSYNEHRISGAPVNLAEKFMEKYAAIPDTILKADVSFEYMKAMGSAMDLITEAFNFKEKEGSHES